jgi:hypothetical protein
MVQVHVLARVWGFESLLRHQNFLQLSENTDKTESLLKHRRGTMPRVQNLFAATALALIALGIFASIPSRSGVPSGFDVLIGGKSGFGLSLEVPLFAMAALFGVFAFLYSIRYIPFSPTMAKWHFWCSLVGVALCITGGAIFRFGAHALLALGSLGVNLMAYTLIAGLLTFLSVQLWFVFDLTRAFLSLRNSS